MTQLWVRTIRKQRIRGSITLPMPEDDLSAALAEACRQLDIPRPLWLGKHEREYGQFQRTSFTQEHFMEAIAFDRLEIERIDPDASPKAPRDPRIEA